MVRMAILDRLHQRDVLNRCRLSHLLNVRLFIQGIHIILSHLLRMLFGFFFWKFKSLFNILRSKIRKFMGHWKLMQYWHWNNLYWQDFPVSRSRPT